MALKKNPKYDLKRKYSRVLEISIIISILFLIAAFKYFPDLKTDTALKETAQDLVNMEDVLITNQSAPPPPPPKPPILIESPTDDYLDDIEIQDTELDVNEVITGPPPPPIDDDEEAFDYFEAVEEQPQPIGGIAAIQAKMKYPEFAKRAGVQGKVWIKAYVDENGIVQQVELVKGIGAGCDEEALKAVKSTLFSPGKQRGKPVKVQVTVPVKFVLR